MFRKIGVVLAAVTLALMIGANQANAMMYADTVVDAVVGGNPKPSPTDNPANALGHPDLGTIPLDEIQAAYYALGAGGTLTLGFPDSFTDRPGIDVVVWEASMTAEWMDIQLVVDGQLQTISPKDQPSPEGTRSADTLFRFEFDLADLGAPPATSWNQLKIVDRETYPVYGGADIDGVGITPVPSAVILASIGLSFAGWKLRRRKKS